MSLFIAPTDVSRLTLIGPAWVAWLTLANPGIGSGGGGVSQAHVASSWQGVRWEQPHADILD